jgi:2,3-dihydroxybenzoate-AMP ligase
MKARANGISPGHSLYKAKIGVEAPMPGVVYPPLRELETYVQAGVLGTEYLSGALQDACRHHAGRTALATPEGSVTYAALDDLVTRAAAALMALGLHPTDRVIFQLINCKELVIAFLGCLRAGLIPVCTLASHREHEIGYIANHAGARAHIVQGDDPKFDHVAFAGELRSRIPSMDVLISARGAARPGIPRLEDLIARTDPAAAAALVAGVRHDPYQVALMQLSGGTSGVPKLIPRFNSEYVYNMRAVAQFLDYRSDDIMLMPMPMIHNASMCCAWGPMLLVGGTFIITPQPTVEVLGEALRRHSPTWLGAGHRELLLRIDEAIKLSGAQTEQVRGVWVINSASFARGEMNLPGHHIFGMGEGLIMFTRPGDPIDIREHTIGRPVSALDRVRVLKPGTEIEAAPGEIGELAVKGPYTIHGYYKAEERNRAAFTSDGEYRSGDLISARVFAGVTYFVFEGRIKDVIDRGGEKISSEEIELALARHPAVAEVAVVGVPDARLGERLCACVLARANGDSASITVAGFGAFLQEMRVAKFKWPEHVELFEEFPMTKIGKIDKTALRELAKERSAAVPKGA